ncbi:MAG: hypothetical protein KatS3mg082_1278 [Nitrospiraceae bacterium]|nr:MAG: hypothetical protein KatS3mg082_1278 [Nitrospiraceae bacterium]
MELFDQRFLASLLREFRETMRNLLADLCDDLEKNYPRATASLGLPVGYFRLVGASLAQESFSGWKVVGWIEELNDLVYFIDLQEQLGRERDPRGFAEAFFAECEEQFYEHSYKDELFPSGLPQTKGLSKRLSALCTRLAHRVTQESLFLVPGLPCSWLGRTGRLEWQVPCDLSPDFEQGVRGGYLSIGVEGGFCRPPASLERTRSGHRCKAMWRIRPSGIWLQVGPARFPVLDYDGTSLRWKWAYNPPRSVSSMQTGEVTIGPALIYGKDKTPIRIGAAPADFPGRVERALAVLEQAWPEGAGLFASLTSRLIPFRARGVVSFSYRHRPGLSFLNCFDRDDLDLIDDLIHENSHHHLNLLLRKYVLYRGDRNQEMFYSPWRRSLRPIRGILHAAFTFTIGAMVFERLSSWAARGEEQGARGRSQSEQRSGTAWLTKAQVLRARFRCLEEIESVRYSIQDLEYAGRRLGWLTGSGKRLVGMLAAEIGKVERKMMPYKQAVLRSKYGPALRRHVEELRRARKTYGPVRLREV